MKLRWSKGTWGGYPISEADGRKQLDLEGNETARFRIIHARGRHSLQLHTERVVYGRTHGSTARLGDFSTAKQAREAAAKYRTSKQVQALMHEKIEEERRKRAGQLKLKQELWPRDGIRDPAVARARRRRKPNPVKLSAQPITWRTDDLSIGRVESILGRDFVARFFDDPNREHAIAAAVSRAHGAWTANEREYYAAYRSLARLLGRKYEERDPRRSRRRDLSSRFIPASKLPKRALKKISAAQRSYIDEFKFFHAPGGGIDAWYAGELLAHWDGYDWLPRAGKTYPARAGWKPPQARDPKHDTKDLVRFVWTRVPKDYRLTSVDGRRGAWIMVPETMGGGMIDLKSMPRTRLLDLARRHFGYRG